LIEDVPGVGKTMMARALALSLRASFGRIQFTPDLLPSDVTGVSIFHPARQAFEFHRGPVFTQVLLADEINRASPRTQSSLLECMEERQVTVDGATYRLEEPFFVVATQNPIELDGTYPLPEAQLDRFLMRLEIGYPDAEEEMRILDEQVLRHPIDTIEGVIDAAALVKLQTRARGIHVSAEVRRYIVDIVNRTREHPNVRLGASPRGALALQRAAQALALIQGSAFVIPDDVKRLAPAVLGHRLVLHPQRQHAGASASLVLEEILERIPVPTLPDEKLHARS
jgi:MoxR-like ATPase